jgi:hypothetical protein
MLNHPSYDEAERILRVGNFIWDTAILDWVKATGTAVAPNVNVTNFPAVQAVSFATPVPVTGPLTAAELAAFLPLPVDVMDLFLLDATFTARINTLGQKLMAASTPVVLASDQSAIPVTGPLTNAELRASPVDTTVVKTDLGAAAPTAAAVGVASGVILAANAARRGGTLRNLSTSGQRVSLAFDGAAAVLDNGVTLFPQDAFSLEAFDFTNGAIAAIASAAAASVAIQEWTT